MRELNMTTENLIYSMLITNTGSHPLDSGSAYGRHWQANQKRSIDDFRAEPEATMNLADNWFDINISVFHYLNKALSQDSICKEYNALDCDDWDGDYYGVSRKQSEWLDFNGFEADGDGFNTYNWDNQFSQVLQGQRLKCNGETFYLLQIHNGCDVRGGYTDAKLFKASDDYFLLDDCHFTINDNLTLDVRGADFELYNNETGDSRMILSDDIKEIVALAGDKKEFIGYIETY